MMRYYQKILLTFCLVFSLSQPVSAQLFGERTLGRSLSRRQPVSMESAGTVDSKRRFVRGQKGKNDFVGSSRGGSQTFVGREQSSTDTTVTSSVTGLREQRSRSVNQPRRISRTGRYPERLVVNFRTPATTPATTISLPPKLLALIEQRGIRIEVSSADRSATLRGVVSSEHEREIAELIVMFEPSIEKVVNELKVE